MLVQDSQGTDGSVADAPAASGKADGQLDFTRKKETTATHVFMLKRSLWTKLIRDAKAKAAVEGVLAWTSIDLKVDIQQLAACIETVGQGGGFRRRDKELR